MNTGVCIATQTLLAAAFKLINVCIFNSFTLSADCFQFKVYLTEMIRLALQRQLLCRQVLPVDTTHVQIYVRMLHTDYNQNTESNIYHAAYIFDKDFL